MAHCSSSSSDLPVQGPQPSHPSAYAASAAGTIHVMHPVKIGASSRAPVACQFGHILASDPSIHFYLWGSHHGAPDDNLSLSLTLYEDPWKIKKVLTMSDVDGSCRLLLSTKAADEHVFSSMGEKDARQCRTGSSKGLEVWDADESCGNNFFLKKWDNTDYFVLTCKWKGNFVNRKNLKEGDMIGLAWDGAQFCFKLLNRN